MYIIATELASEAVLRFYSGGEYHAQATLDVFTTFKDNLVVRFLNLVEMTE